MKVELDLEETCEVVTMIINRIGEAAHLSDKDRAALRRWRGSLKPGSEAVRRLAQDINAALARTLENQRRSAVVKPDWR
jgi:hypothetical protein